MAFLECCPGVLVYGSIALLIALLIFLSWILEIFKKDKIANFLEKAGEKIESFFSGYLN